MLGHGAGTDVQVLGQPLHGLHQGLGHHQPAQSPAGHAEVLGKTVDADHVVAEREPGLAKAFVKAQPQVDLVQQQGAPALPNRAVDGPHFVGRHRRTGGIGRGSQEHAGGIGLPGVVDGRGGELVTGGRGGRQQAGAGPHGRQDVPVARVAGVWHQQFLAGVHHRQTGQLKRRRSPGRDDYAARRHVHAPALSVPAAQGLAQSGQARGAGVLGMPLSDGRFGGGLHPRRCREIRFADVEVDHPRRTGRQSGSQGMRLLGHLHDVKRIDLLRALRKLCHVGFN